MLDRGDIELLGESVDRFADESYGFDRFRALADTPDRFGRDEWRQYGDLGWLALTIPEADGGLDGGAIAFARVMRAVGRGLLREPFLPTLALGATLIVEAGSEAQRTALLPEIASGALLVAFAHGEPGSAVDPRGPKTIAVRDGADYRLTGAKLQVLAGPCADRLIVSAADADVGGGAALFLIDADAAGLTWIPYPLLDGRLAGDLHLDGVRAASADRLAGDARHAIEAALGQAILAISAEATGAMERLIAITVEYLKTRKQFGAPLSSFQVLKHRMADMLIGQYEVAALVRTTAEAMVAGGHDVRTLTAALKARMSLAARQIGEAAVQLHGGMGMTDELPVGHYFKRLLTLSTLFGDSNYYYKLLETYQSR